MKSLKIVFSVLALAIAFGAPVAKAQDAKKQSMAEKAKTAYNLTDDQYKQVSAIYKESAAQKKALPNDDTKKTRSDVINDDTRAKVRAVLTPEQQVKFDEANKKPASKTKGADKGKGAGKKKDGDKKKARTE
jgi:type II secretory pathway pseudopilin PulG